MKGFTTALIIILSTTSVNLGAQESAHHSGQASKHSALAASHGVASTAMVASAVMVAPVVVAGGVSLVAGSVVSEVGGALLDSAKTSNSSTHHHHRLVITQKTITADPAPNQVIKKQ